MAELPYIQKRPRKPISLKMQMHLLLKYGYYLTKHHGTDVTYPPCKKPNSCRNRRWYTVSMKSRGGAPHHLLHNAILDHFGDEVRECRKFLRERERKRNK